jgi:hypothetical protein
VVGIKRAEFVILLWTFGIGLSIVGVSGNEIMTSQDTLTILKLYLLPLPLVVFLGCRRVALLCLNLWHARRFFEFKNYAVTIVSSRKIGQFVQIDGSPTSDVGGLK